MNLPLALGIVIAAAAGALLVLALIRRTAHGPLLKEPARGTPMMTIVGTAFAVLLAFVTLAAFQTYNGAKRGAESEAVAVLEMFRTAALFPANQRDRLRADFVCYGRAVADQEWPAMRDGHRTPEVDHWIVDYRDLFNRLDLGRARERLGFQALLAEASQRTDGRRERLSQVTPSVPSPLWLVLRLGPRLTVALPLRLAAPPRAPLPHGA